MATEVFNRYEHKYMLSGGQYEQIIQLLNGRMMPDIHNAGGKTYPIANIYYDTPEDMLIRHSLSKPEYKEKLRLRAYGVPREGDRVFLEIKKKYGGVVNKRRTTLTTDEAYDFIRTGQILKPKEYMNMQVVKEIEYFLKTHDVSPKVYLAYDRTAYFEKGTGDLRISIDTNIRSRRNDLKLEDGDYGTLLLGGNTYLMEVKTETAKPLWLVRELTRLKIRKISFSKYGTEYRNTITENMRKEAI